MDHFHRHSILITHSSCWASNKLEAHWEGGLNRATLVQIGHLRGQEAAYSCVSPSSTKLSISTSMTNFDSSRRRDTKSPQGVVLPSPNLVHHPQQQSLQPAARYRLISGQLNPFPAQEPPSTRICKDVCQQSSDRPTILRLLLRIESLRIFRVPWQCLLAREFAWDAPIFHGINQIVDVDPYIPQSLFTQPSVQVNLLIVKGLLPFCICWCLEDFRRFQHLHTVFASLQDCWCCRSSAQILQRYLVSVDGHLWCSW